jgi:hypothetical protein
MSRRRRRLVASAALALALGAGLAAWRLRGGGAAPPSAAASAEDEEAARPVPPGRAGPSRALTPQPPIQVATPDRTTSAGGAGSFEGRVVSSATGAGVPGAELTFSRSGEATVVTGAPDGGFRFAPRQPGRWTLAAVSAPGFFPFAPEWGHSPVLLDAREGATVRDVTVTLAPAVDYRGRVVDAAGAPLAGVEVRVLGAAAGETALLPLRDRYASDAAGEFTFRAPEGATLEARHPGYAPARADLDFAATVSRRLTLTLEAWAPGEEERQEAGIAGRVDLPGGQPAGGALVIATAWDAGDGPPRQATAAADGRFALPPLPAGRYRVVATRPGSAPVERDVRAGATDLVLRLAEGGRVAGRVRDRSTGQPVAPFTVAVRARGRRFPLRTLAVVDPSGRYEVADLPPGRAFVVVAAPGRAPSAEQEVTVPEPGQPPAVADFELSAGGRLHGRVVDARTGAPVAGAAVELEGQVELGPSLLPVRAAGVSGPDGRFELSGVPERPASLRAQAPGHHARLIAGFEVREGEARGPVLVELTPLEPGEEPKLELTGIGATLAPRRDALRVTAVLPRGGAAEAGIVPGDELTRIDGRPVADLSFAAAVNLIRGPEDSSVVLGVRKADDPQRTELRVVVYRRLIRN